jgi:hypothetical protein
MVVNWTQNADFNNYAALITEKSFVKIYAD